MKGRKTTFARDASLRSDVLLRACPKNDISAWGNIYIIAKINLYAVVFFLFICSKKMTGDAGSCDV